MLVSSDDLRSHVPGSSGGVLLIFRGIYPGYSHISEPEVPLGVKDEIFGFDVPVNDVVFMETLEAEEDAADKKFDNMFWEHFCSSDLKS